MMRIAFLGATVILSLLACDGGGNWVDGTWLVGCEAQTEAAKTNALGKDNMMTMEAHAICRKAGKAFTGDFRCENKVGQVKCK